MGVELLSVDDGLYCRPSGVWAEEKLDYLRRYIEIFEFSMQKKWDVRNYIDILAGPGKNFIKEKKVYILGSPLIALTIDPPFSNYYFIEENKTCFDALSTRVNLFSSSVKLYNADTNKIIDTVLSDLQKMEDSSLNLAFIDPEGLEVEWTTIEKLGRIKRMDLIFNYPQQALTRNMPQLSNSPPANKVDRYFGDTHWREIFSKWKSRNNLSGVHRELMEYYLSKLSQFGYSELKRDDEVLDEPLMRNSQKHAPLYRLMFASKHPLGQDFWRKITSRDLHGQKRLFN